METASLQVITEVENEDGREGRDALVTGVPWALAAGAQRLEDVTAAHQSRDHFGQEEALWFQAKESLQSSDGGPGDRQVLLPEMQWGRTGGGR